MVASAGLGFPALTRAATWTLTSSMMRAASAFPSRTRAVTATLSRDQRVAGLSEAELFSCFLRDDSHHVAKRATGLLGQPAAVFVLGRDVDSLAAELLDLDASNANRRLDLLHAPVREDSLDRAETNTERRAVPQQFLAQECDVLRVDHHGNNLAEAALLHERRGDCYIQRASHHQIVHEGRDEVGRHVVDVGFDHGHAELRRNLFTEPCGQRVARRLASAEAIANRAQRNSGALEDSGRRQYRRAGRRDQLLAFVAFFEDRSSPRQHADAGGRGQWHFAAPAAWRRQRRRVDALDSQVTEEPERTEEIDQRVRATELVQVQMRFVGVVKLGLDSCEQTKGAQRILLGVFRHLGFLQRRTQLRNSPVRPASGRDLDSCATEVATMLTTDIDLDLVAEPQRFYSGVEHGAISTGVDQGAQHHVARDAGEAVEIDDAHRRARRMSTAAPSIGLMLAGRFVTLTDTALTRATCSALRAMRPARVSMRCAGSPSITSFAIARTRR